MKPIEAVATTVQLTINYVDHAGQTIAPTTQGSGAQGTAFSITTPTISGYRLVDPNQQTVAGTYHGNQMTLTLIYQPESTVSAVTPPTGNGDSITDGTATGNPTIENPVTTEQPTSDVITSVALEPTTVPVSNTKPEKGGTAVDAPETLTPNVQQSVGERQKTTNQRPTAPMSKQSISANLMLSGQPASTTRLPQTSEQSNSIVAFIGAGLLTIVANLGWRLKLRRKGDR